MSDSIYQWYCATKKLIKNVGDHKTPETDEMIKGWQESLEIMELSCSGIKEMYERRTATQQSFTPEQIDHICYMIGDWYLEWKNKILVDGKTNQHRLGVAKETLKTMICGE